MQREMKRLIEKQPLDKFCPICGISLSSPVVCLSHYIGKNHIKKSSKHEFDNQQEVLDRIAKLGKSLGNGIGSYKPDFSEEITGSAEKYTDQWWDEWNLQEDAWQRTSGKAKKFWTKKHIELYKAYKSLNFGGNMKKNTIDVQGSQMPVPVYPLGKFGMYLAVKVLNILSYNRSSPSITVRSIKSHWLLHCSTTFRQSSYVTQNGMNSQKRAFNRIFNEPNPISDDIEPKKAKSEVKIEVKHEIEIEDGEVDEIVDEEDVVDGGFHERIDGLYQKNERL